MLPLFLLARMPLGFGSHGFSGVEAIRSDSLVSGDDGTEGSSDDAFHPLVKQEQLLEAAFKAGDTVLEVGLAARHGGSGWRAAGRILGIAGS